MSDDLTSQRRTLDLADAAAVVALVLVALSAMHSSYGGVTYLVLGVVGAVVGATCAVVGRQLNWPFVLTAVLAIGLYVVLCSVLVLRQDAIAGVIPSPRSILLSLTAAVTGWKELITTVPPVGSTGDLLVLPSASAMLASFAGTTLALRARFAPLAVIPPVIVLGLGIAVGLKEPVSILLHGTVFAGLTFAWLAWREHRRRPLLEGSGLGARRFVSATLVLGIAALAGLFVAPNLPGAEASDRAIWRQVVTPPFDPRQYPSPLSSFRQYVKPGYDAEGQRNEPSTMFTIEGLPAGIPVRLASMDTYDGFVWQVSAGDRANPSLLDSGSFERIGTRLTPEFDGPTADLVITIHEYTDVWVPTVGELISVRFAGSSGGPERDRALADSFRYNRATNTGASVLRLTEGDRIEMTVRLPEMPEALTGRTIRPDVPRLGVAQPVSEIAQQLATPDILVIDDTGARLDRIRDVMVINGAYSDGDRDAGHQRARAGHDAARMIEFVQGYPTRPLIGNAEQYASAFALLFRNLDRLPTRVVMGFVPPEASDRSPVQVVATDVEAWVEVPLVDTGWVGVFPTPPRDQLASTSTSPQQPEPDYRTQPPPPPPIVDPEFDQPAKAAGEAVAPVDDEAPVEERAAPIVDDGTVETAALARPAVVAAGVVSVPLVLALAAALVIIVIKARRRRRRRRIGPGHHRIANGWREVTDLARDMGRPVPSGTTRREAAAFAGASTAPLAERADAAVWGGAELTDAEVDAYWHDLTATLDAMKSELGLIERLKTAISLESLRAGRHESSRRSTQR